MRLGVVLVLVAVPVVARAQATRVVPQDPAWTAEAMQQRAQQWQDDWLLRALLEAQQSQPRRTVPAWGDPAPADDQSDSDDGD
jgi:hypothetical protein